MQRNSKLCPINRKKELAIETAFEEAQMVDVAEKNFKAAIIYMIEEQKETMLKELKEDMKTMSHQRDNINKEIEIFKLLKGIKWIFWS